MTTEINAVNMLQSQRRVVRVYRSQAADRRKIHSAVRSPFSFRCKLPPVDICAKPVNQIYTAVIWTPKTYYIKSSLREKSRHWRRANAIQIWRIVLHHLVLADADSVVDRLRNRLAVGSEGVAVAGRVAAVVARVGIAPATALAFSFVATRHDVDQVDAAPWQARQCVIAHDVDCAGNAIAVASVL